MRLTSLQVIDYKLHNPLTGYLTEKYAEQPFDFIFDTQGVQDLYKKSPNYLKKEGLHINIGINDGVKSILRWGKNVWLPKAVGGVPRTYVMFTTVLDTKTGSTLADLAEQKHVRPVVAEIFEMEDALKVFKRPPSS
jgi:NADPH:quinone reductase-like Zn-dependent oxidoreductase